MLSQGRYLAVAGQIGWDESGRLVSEDFAGQTRQALHNVLAVLHAAGAQASHLVRLTWYVTDKEEYRANLRAIGAAYRETIGAHFPTMTLVEVRGLLEPGAKVEIEATAVLPA
jgi:enamine deaminase RidA (YjgF/YER057c/UK114 family)